MPIFRRKRRPDGRSYSHPIGTPGTTFPGKLLDAETRFAQLIAAGLSPEEANRVIIEEQKGEQSVFGHPHPGEELETSKTPSNVTIQPPISITVQSGAGGPAQTPLPPREPVTQIEKITGDNATEELPPTHLVGNVDEVESGLRDYIGVSKVKVKGIRKKRIDVETNEGTKLTYKKTVDRKGRIHWNRMPPKEEDIEGDEESEESSGEGNFWS